MQHNLTNYHTLHHEKFKSNLKWSGIDVEVLKINSSKKDSMYQKVLGTNYSPNLTSEYSVVKTIKVLLNIHELNDSTLTSESSITIIQFNNELTPGDVLKYSFNSINYYWKVIDPVNLLSTELSEFTLTRFLDLH